MTLLHHLGRAVHAGAWVVVLTSSSLAHASQPNLTRFELMSRSPKDSGIHFDLSYTTGTHRGVAKAASGDVIADLTGRQIVSAHFSVPIAELTTDNEKRDCHMRESLGIDYSPSHYPSDHVCKDEVIPASGVDSVVFPKIELTFKESATPLTDEPGGIRETLVKAELSMHGVTKTYTLPVRIEPLNTPKGKPLQFRLQSRFPVLLKDFGIVVKNFLIISVSHEATVIIDIRLKAVN